MEHRNLGEALTALNLVVDTLGREIKGYEDMLHPVRKCVNNFVKTFNKMNKENPRMYPTIFSNFVRTYRDNLVQPIINEEGDLKAGWLLQGMDKTAKPSVPRLAKPKGISIFITDDPEFVRTCIPVSEIFVEITKIFDRDDNTPYPYTFMYELYSCLHLGTQGTIPEEDSTKLLTNVTKLRNVVNQLAVPSPQPTPPTNPLGGLSNMLNGLLGGDSIKGMGEMFQNFLSSEQFSGIASKVMQVSEIAKENFSQNQDLAAALGKTLEADPVKDMLNLANTLMGSVSGPTSGTKPEVGNPSDQE